MEQAGALKCGQLDREVSVVLFLDIASPQAYAFQSKLSPDMTDNRRRAKVPESATNITLSGQKCKLVKYPAAELRGI